MGWTPLHFIAIYGLTACFGLLYMGRSTEFAIAAASLILGYFYGTSAGSRDKDKIIAAMGGKTHE